MELADEVRERLYLAGAEPGKRLVEQKQLRPGRERPRDLEPAEIAVGQHVDERSRLWRQAHVLEHRVGAGARMPLVSHARGEAGDLDVLEHAHAEEGPGELEGAGEPAVDDAIGRQAEKRPSVELHLARIRGYEAGEQIEERRLAGAVGAEHAGDRARIEREGDVLHGLQPAEALVEPVDGEQCAHCTMVRKRRQRGATSPCGRKNRMSIRMRV